MLLLLLLFVSPYQQRVETVRRTPGFVALWDFVLRESPGGRFDAWRARDEHHDLRLDPVNYVRDYWNAGRPATLADFPLLAEGPFGSAVQFRAESDPDFRPLLLVPRSRLHDSGLDVKGPGRSVTLVAWVKYESGNHAIAGIWHEGTDLTPAARVERGRRQYALFAGLAANSGAPAVHVSENGAASFGDRYARNLAVSPEPIPKSSWSTLAFTFDAKRHTVTSFLNGEAREMWIENPENHPFFQFAARAWARGEYQLPEHKPRSIKCLSESPTERVELHTFAFSKVRVTLHPDARGRLRLVHARHLAALKVNPYYFPHPLWTPPNPASGGPFTIGRVIHSGRSGAGFVGAIGGVAVFRRALTSAQLRRLVLPPLSPPSPESRLHLSGPFF